MRQVPQYLLIGNGRVARHFRHYFFLLGIPFLSWSRHEGLDQLKNHLNVASHILLLISDYAIDDFIAQYLDQTTAIKVHFSGSLLSTYAYGVHPLMSFNEGMYGLEQYQKIPFVIESDAPEFSELLPGLSNQHARLNKELKSKYHAYCVLANNFSCLLWQKFMQGLSDEFNLPVEFAQPILQQSTQNLLENPQVALTGPLVRDDFKTIQENLNALVGDPFQLVYQSFVEAYQSRGK